MTEKRKTRKEAFAKVVISPPFEKVYNIPFLQTQNRKFPKRGRNGDFHDFPHFPYCFRLFPEFSPNFSLLTEKPYIV